MLHENYLFIRGQLLSWHNTQEIIDLGNRLGYALETEYHRSKAGLVDDLLRRAHRAGRAADLIALLYDEQPTVNWPSDYAVASNSPESYSIFKESHASLNRAEVLTKLNDWKLLHHSVQELLLASLGLESNIRSCVQLGEDSKHNNENNQIRLLFERAIYDVDRYWVVYCRRAAKMFVTCVDGLSFNREYFILELARELDVANEGNNIEAQIKALDRNNFETPKHLAESFESLKHLLTQILVLADHQILALVDVLRSN